MSRAASPDDASPSVVLSRQARRDRRVDDHNGHFLIAAVLGVEITGQFRCWSRIIGPLVIVYTVIGLLVDLAATYILPDMR